MFTIGIMVFNQLEITKQCIKNLRDNAAGPVEIMILDNGSDLAIQQELKKLCEIYIRNDVNLGVIHGLNQIYKNTNSPWIMYIHNDLMVLEQDWDVRVENLLSSIDNLGVVGFGGGNGVTTDGLRFNFTSNMVNAEAHGKRLYENYIPAVVEDGMCLIVNRELIDKLGGIALAYNIHHFYDLDICVEAIYHGYKVVTLGCSIDHLSGQTANGSDYHLQMQAKGTSDLEIHVKGKVKFNEKWKDYFPIKVDNNFNYMDSHGQIKCKIPIPTNPSFCLISGLNTFGKWTTPGNEIRSWAYAMNGDVYNGAKITDYSFFDQYDITMIELTHPMLPIAINLKANSKTKVVGLVEGGLFPGWDLGSMVEYIRVINTIDVVGIINEKARSLISKLTNKPVHMIGIPYPLTWAITNTSTEKEFGLIELGSTPIGKGGIWTFGAFSGLENVHGIAYVLNDNDFNGTKSFITPNMTLEHTKGWDSYFIEHTRHYIGLHLDDRATWGRFSLDCAAAKIPCVSTTGSHTQSILFPDLTIEYYEIDKAIILCNKLLTDRDFYEHTVNYAFEQIKQFDLEPTKQRFLNMI